MFLDRPYAESQVSKQIHAGDVLTVHTGYIGISCVVPEKYDNCLTFTTLITTTDDAVLEGAFLAQYLNSEIGMSAVQAVTTQGGRQNLNTNDFVKVEIRYPSLAEQSKICAVLSRIDNLITLHQRKYDKLVNIKKSMLEKMFPRDGASVPEIRFSGFTDPWEQRKLGDTFDFLQNNTLSRADLDAETGVAKNVHYGDVLIKFGEYLDASSSALPYIPSQQIVDKFKGSLLQDGDVIMADTAEDEAVGKCTEIAGLQGFPTISGLHTIPLRPKEKFASGYLGYYMNSGSYHNQLLPLMQGIKVTSVSKSAISNTDISFPYDRDEQAEIGGFFIRLDNLITLHQCKYLMFPAFSQINKSLSDTLSWEQRKLGECFSERVESDPNGELISVTIGSGIKKFSELGRHDNSNDDKSKYKKVVVGDIAYNSMRMWQGASGYSPYNGIVSPAYTVMTPFSGIDSKFFAYMFKREDMIHTFQIRSQGITSDNWNLKFPTLSEIPVMLPITVEEQTAIAGYLTILDTLITLHQRKLEKLKNIKKSMLEKMFV